MSKDSNHFRMYVRAYRQMWINLNLQLSIMQHGNWILAFGWWAPVSSAKMKGHFMEWILNWITNDNINKMFEIKMSTQGHQMNASKDCRIVMTKDFIRNISQNKRKTYWISQLFSEIFWKMSVNFLGLRALIPMVSSMVSNLR